MATGFTVLASGSLTAATPKTVLALTAGTGKMLTVCEFGVSFDGTTSTATPVLVELIGGTGAGAGSGSAFPPLIIRGDPNEAAVATCLINCTTEPTVLSSFKYWLVSPTSGMIMQFPLGREIYSTVAAASARKIIGLRLTAPAGVNYKTYAEIEE